MMADEGQRIEQLPGIENTSLKEAYDLLGACTPVELSQKYAAEDQKLMTASAWDYKNPDLVINQVRAMLEPIKLTSLSERERTWVQEILWFWYHHAISCAIWRYHDKAAAQMYSEKALAYQDQNHPNRITRLLYLLVHDAEKEATEWAQAMEREPEKSTAQELLRDWRTVTFSS